jgi:hypothetical protein
MKNTRTNDKYILASSFFFLICLLTLECSLTISVIFLHLLLHISSPPLTLLFALSHQFLYCLESIFFSFLVLLHNLSHLIQSFLSCLFLGLDE